MRSLSLLLVLSTVVACKPIDEIADPDGDGFTEGDGDCAPDDAAVHPDATEVCGDGLDNDCDGEIDNDGTGGLDWYLDVDGDGFGIPEDTLTACAQPDGYVSDAGDCDDDTDTIHPDASEVCDGIDNDCANGPDDGLTFFDAYPDVDGDDFGTGLAVSVCELPADHADNADDCDDTRDDHYPGATPICGLDANCDNVLDVGHLQSCPATACAGMPAGDLWFDFDGTTGWTACDSREAVRWDSEHAWAGDAAGFYMQNVGESIATWTQLPNGGDWAVELQSIGDPNNTRCETLHAGALVNLPFVSSFMDGTVTMHSLGTEDLDDTLAYGDETTAWVPFSSFSGNAIADCPGMQAIGTDLEFMKLSGTLDYNWSLTGSERVVTFPGDVATDTRQLRMVHSDHSRLLDAERLLISWSLWLKP